MPLSKQLALVRRSCFDPEANLQYTLHIELINSNHYVALIDIQFTLTQVHPDISLDWQGPNIKTVWVNDQDAEHVLENQLLKFPKEGTFTVGANRIRIHFQNDYSTDGHGLHSFVDADNAQYIYSQLEPHHASKMIPCFDQPDLKGRFKLIAYAPNEFKVISNESLQQEKSDIKWAQDLGIFTLREGYSFHEFANTVPLSTYLFAILAGPYVEIPAPEKYLPHGIPMSLFCRASLRQHVEKDSEEIFSLTQRGFAFYESLFKTPYPFSKYDQIFCPEYSSGAMENAGAVTINDSYVFKEDVPLSQRADRANTILHELSHMWFGDLVTMKWWDDLWLNESFAEFISHLCQTEANNIFGVDHWVDFYKRKIWGYVEDQIITTHPIYCDIENTDQAENIFDGITYAKGAAVLKQLYFMMGKDKFSEAMGEYFDRFKFRNSTLADFFGVMKKAFEGDYLLQWEQDWIMKAGLNSVSARIEGNQIHFTQSATRPEHPTLRSQIFKIAIFDNEGVQLGIQQVELKPQEETVVQLSVENGAYLLLNFNDESFVKTSYSRAQAAFFLANLSKVEPSLSRVLLLRSIWDQVRDGELEFLVFIDGVVNHLSNEKDDTVSQMVLSWCSGGLDFYTPRLARPQLADKLANLVIQMLRQTDKANKNKALVLKGYLASWGRSKEILGQLVECLRSDEGEFGFIGLRNGWKILRNAFAQLDLEKDEKWKLFDRWAERDGSDEVRKQKRFLECLHSDQNLWEYLINFNKEESVQQAAEVMAAFNHDIHLDRLKEYESKFFEVLPQIYKTKSSEYAKSFYSNLYPINDNIEYYQQKCQELLAQTENDFLKRQLMESIDMDARRLKTYRLFEGQKQQLG